MEPEVSSTQIVTEIGQMLWSRGETLLNLLLRPWNAYQIAIAVGLLILAHLLARVLGERLRDKLRDRTHWPKWRLRAALIFVQRLRALFLVILLWTTVFVIRDLTWPSRSYILAILANMATAWLIVSYAGRLIANRPLRSLVTYAAWIWVALRILKLDGETEALLDRMAITLGDTRISVWLVLQAAVILGVLMTVARLISQAVSQRLEANSDISPSMKVLTVKFLQVVVYGIALIVGLRTVGFDLTGLAVLSGAIGVGLGFGLQKVVSNLVSGIIILLDKSIKPGDVISLGDTFGWIATLSSRYVSVVTRDGRAYLIPNEDLITGQVVNWSHSDQFVRLDIKFGCSYRDDPHLVRQVAIETATGVNRVKADRKPVCHITGFGDSSVDYVLRFWIVDPAQGLTNVRGDVFLALWDAFKAHGITIPFPQREVRLLEGSMVKTKAISD
ncbi:MAG: mechanosensitive ion channel family protein [Qingshengfaniella sp.]